MVTLAGSVVASMVIDDMLKDDGGLEATQLLAGDGYKRRKYKSHAQMGSVAARLAV